MSRSYEVLVTIAIEVEDDQTPANACVKLNNAEVWMGDEQAAIVGWETCSVEEIE